MQESESYNGWHFLPEDGCIANKKKKIKVMPRRTYAHKSKLWLCNHGLHASARAIDALQYAPGPIACRVILSGKVIIDMDKMCASRRKVLAVADASRVLHEFAYWCAESVLDKCDPSVREIAKKTIDTKRAWLDGKATESDLAAAMDASRDTAWDTAWAASWAASWEAARAAARDAARAAARAAAWAAAWDAARAAAWATAWATARDAAWAAARAAAWDAAWAAARDTARDAAWDAAWAAARDTAWAAARDAQNQQLEEMLSKLLGLKNGGIRESA